MKNKSINIVRSLVYALVQCRRVFQSLRCIRSLRSSTKRYQCIQCGSVLSVALLYTVASLSLCLWYTTSDSVQTYFLLFFLCLFCLFTPRIALCAQLYLKQIDPCRLPHWSTHITTDLVVYRSATWWLNYGRDRRHTSRPTNSPASPLHYWRIFQLRRPVPPTYHPRLVLIWRLRRRWPARDPRPRPLPKPLIVVRVPLRPRPGQMGP